MEWSARQRYAAEFLGTMALLLAVGGAAVFTAVYVVGTAAQASVILAISFSVGLVLLAMIYTFGDVSGGHFNPAVTVSMAMSGRMR